MATLTGRPALGWHFLAVLALLLVTGLASRTRLDAGEAMTGDGTAAGFVAERAHDTLAHLLGDQRPHPVDSEANAQVMMRIVDAMESAGYRVDVQQATACSPATLTCALVRNVIAIHEGEAGGKAVLVSGHYDSVPAGPGASDDGVGVAIMIESARTLKQRPPGRNAVIFLFSDGEEAGLLGARAFASRHPLAERIAAVVNIEARGTSGQSVMFETGNSSGALIGEFADSAKRPIANSLLAMAYKLLPNDTDLSVFKAEGMQGLNFAFGERQPYYHTPLDNLQNLDPGTLQAQGDNIHGLVMGLVDADLDADSDAGGTVYTDILGFGMVQWPQRWGPFIAGFLLIAFAAITPRLRKLDADGRGGLWWGLAAMPVSLLLGLAAAYLLTYLLAMLNGGASGWFTDSLSNRVLLWSLVLLVAVSALRLLARRGNPMHLWIGLVWSWLLASLALAVVAPGASYLFLLPSAAAVACGLALLAMASRPGAGGLHWVLVLPALVGFSVLVPAVHLVEIMMGFNSIIGVLVMGGLLGVAATSALPFARPAWAPVLHRGVSGLLLVAVAAAFVLAIRAPAYTAEKPQHLNVLYIQGSDQKAVVTAGNASSRPPATVLEAMGADAAPVQAFPWNSARFRAIAVANAGLPAAQLVVIDEVAVPEGRRVTARIDAPADAYLVQLLFPEEAGLKTVETDGQRLEYAAESDFPVSFICRGASCNGRQLILTLAEGSHGATVVAMSKNLPDAAAAIADSRGLLAVPRHDGDQSVVISQARL